MKNIILSPIFIIILFCSLDLKIDTHPVNNFKNNKHNLTIATAITAHEDCNCLGKKHGYVETPRSRAYKCSSAGGHLNTNCGLVQYEPQSLEFIKGYPKIGENGPGPADGQLAGVGLFPEIDEQSKTRWHKEVMSPGVQEFYWRFVAAHATTKYEYYITKVGWNPNKPLSRSAFETEPFATIDGGGEIPWLDDQMLGVPHVVDVPERTGYHIIYCVWEIDDTVNSFYSIIDADFGE